MNKIYIEKLSICEFPQNIYDILIDNIWWSYTQNIKDASIAIFLSCSVSNSFINLYLNKVTEISKQSHIKKIILSWCFVDRDDIMKRSDNRLVLINWIEYKDILSEVGISIEEEILVSKENNTVIIAEGCAYNCSYCNIRRAKWLPKSESIENILSMIEKKPDLNEYVLLSDDTWSYGIDIWTDLIDLLDNIITKYPNIRLFLPSFHPYTFLKLYDRMKKYIYSWNISTIYISIQSISENVLKFMNRGYNIEKLKSCILDMRKKSKVNVFTDIIYNFPIWTEIDLIKTVEFSCNLFDEITFNSYSRNKNTQAYNLLELSEKQKQRNRKIIIKTLDLLLKKKYIINVKNNEIFDYFSLNHEF